MCCLFYALCYVAVCGSKNEFVDKCIAVCGSRNAIAVRSMLLHFVFVIAIAAIDSKSDLRHLIRGAITDMASSTTKRRG